MNLQVSSSPHIRDKSQTSRIMIDVIIALLPALAAASYFLGLRVLLVAAVTIAGCVGFEYLTRRLMKRENTVGDMSAVLTGLLLSFSLTPAVPLWICLVGSFIAIVVVKQMFGGIGSNFVNPAITARIILVVSFPSILGTYFTSTQADLVSTSTPLAMIKAGAVTAPDYMNMFLGVDKAGSAGEISILALLIGAFYLIIRKVIKIWIPLSFIGTVALLVWLTGGDVLYHLLSGGLVLGAFFMATDYATSPLTNKGKLVFGVGCGLITGLIRLFGGMPEGVAFSILIMNIVTPHLDTLFIPTVFGGGKKRA